MAILNFQSTQKLKYFKWTIQWLFMYSLGLIKFMVSEKIVYKFSHMVLC